jgi:Gamma interferon inducible lysosomal thiol reductase (GILT)
MIRQSGKINFTLSFIGTPTDPDDGVECMHGPNECLGNIVELCAASLYPDPKIYLGFAMCLSREYQQIPSRALVSDCALEHGIEFEKLNDCASRDSGAFGIGLLRDSVRRSQTLGVTKSCTVSG